MGSEKKSQVLWHEIVHAMLDEMGESELSENEKFVDVLAKHIYGVLTRNNHQQIVDELGVGLCGRQ